MIENDISKEIVDACFALHVKFGPGLFESVYEELLTYELKKRKRSVKRQEAINLMHDDLIFAKAFRADLLVENLVLIEIKSVEELKEMHF